MSFQGDVRGIGLAELLQGLARGRKEGLLSLGGSGRSSCLIGLNNGQLILLPDEEESDESIAERVRIAYAHGLEDAVDADDIERIGAADRLEALYSLLDGGEVHFRFDPGDLAQLDAGIGPNSGTQLELILLEYARISDELEGFAAMGDLPTNAVPQWVDANQVQGASPKLIAELDGRSTIQEIGDRLAWPARQTRLTLCGLFQSGALRLSTHQELLALTLHELEARQFSRACQRLRAWVQNSPPGPMHPEAANVLGEEWLSGRLPAAMRGMKPKETRSLLRRLDATINSPSTSVSHWNEAVQIHPEDAICRMHAMGLQYAEDDRSERPSVRDLLSLSRKLKEAGNPNRGAPLLLIAVQKKPEGLGQKLEVGLGLLEAGQPEHGGPWVLAAAHSLVDRGQSDRALGPLRMLIEAYPQSREAKALLTKAKRASTQAKKFRRNVYIGAAGLTLLAAGALVKVRADHKRSVALDEVRALIDTPDAALASLNRHFTGDTSPNVLRLRRRIENSQRAIEVDLREEWLDHYKTAQEFAKNSGPEEALEKVRNLPPVPRLMLLNEEWPPIGDLFELMGKRLVLEVGEQGDVQARAQTQVQMEQDLLRQSQLLASSFTEQELRMPEIQALQEVLTDFDATIAERTKRRKALEDREDHRTNLARQDDLREQGEQAEARGDYERALHFYQEILGGDLDPRVREYIQPQVDALQGTIETIAISRALAHEGRHEEALEELQSGIHNPDHFVRIMVPWRVTSYPVGAKVLTSTGHEYTTPFEIESTPREAISLTFQSAGFVDEVVEIDSPQNVDLFLSRTPETSWKAKGRVDAIPVPFDLDHIMVDRDGLVARVRPGGSEVWSKQIPTLSGVARAPVFFPGGSGTLLLVTEEGAAWLVDAADGGLEGPWELGSPPRVGPLANSSHVHVLLANGSWAQWKDALQPEMLSAHMSPYDEASCQTYRYGPNNGMQVLRSREGEVRTLVSKFTGWSATVEGSRLDVTSKDGSEGYSARVYGRWTFLAWEPATAKNPAGRIWISDDYGLRALVQLDSEQTKPAGTSPEEGNSEPLDAKAQGQNSPDPEPGQTATPGSEAEEDENGDSPSESEADSNDEGSGESESDSDGR